MCQPHGLLGGKIQIFRGLLLQGTGGEGQRRLLGPLSPLHIRHLVRNAVQFFENLIQLLPGGNSHFLFFFSVKLCRQRFFLSRNLKIRLQCPVFFRNKGIDLILPVSDNPQGHRLYPSGAQSPFNLLPQKGADPVSHHPVQHSSGLLLVHQIHVNLSGVLDGLLHRGFGDLVEGNPAHLAAVQIQSLGQMPGNRLTFAVRVGRKIDFFRLLRGLAQPCQQFALSADGDILRFIIVFYINPKLTLGKISDMAV